MAVNESCSGQSASKEQRIAYHSVGEMADFDFYIGREAHAQQHARYPVWQGQVDIPHVHTSKLDFLRCCMVHKVKK